MDDRAMRMRQGKLGKEYHVEEKEKKNNNKKKTAWEGRIYRIRVVIPVFSVHS